MSIGMTRVFDEDLGAGFGTRAIHAGQRPEPLAGAIMKAEGGKWKIISGWLGAN